MVTQNSEWESDVLKKERVQWLLGKQVVIVFFLFFNFVQFSCSILKPPPSLLLGDLFISPRHISHGISVSTARSSCCHSCVAAYGRPLILTANSTQRAQMLTHETQIHRAERSCGSANSRWGRLLVTLRTWAICLPVQCDSIYLNVDSLGGFTGRIWWGPFFDLDKEFSPCCRHGDCFNRHHAAANVPKKV